MELYYNKDRTKYAVLVSHGFGIGWSTDMYRYPEIAYDKRVIDWYLQLTPEQMQKLHNYTKEESYIRETQRFFRQLGYKECVSFLGLKPDMIEWVPVGSTWRILEYDGAEHIEYFDPKMWNCF